MRDSITVNITPAQRRDLGALAHVRGSTMYDIAVQACEDYLATKLDATRLAPRRTLRDREATFRFSMRIPPDLQQRLEERAAAEIGEPRTPQGAPGRKTYKATIIRRAISYELGRMTPDELKRVDLYLASAAA